MSRLFDASSIFKAVKENLVEALMGGYTLEIARYELGNILWKENVLRCNIDDKEVLVFARLVKDILGLMRLLHVDCHEEQILDTARSLKITFYDASYVYYSKQMAIPLVTEDLDLVKKVKNHIKTSSLSS